MQDPETTPTERPSYAWLFLSFSVLWVKCRETSKVSCLVVCFDDFYEQATVRDMFREGLRTLEQNYTAHSLSVYDTFLKVIIWQYDRALWLFRKPVRNIEKASNPTTCFCHL